MKLRILVVDDEKIIREGISFLTDWEKLDCVLSATASDGREAITYLETHRDTIDVVISDIRMPDIDGIGVALYVSEHCPLTKTIILTAYTDFSYAQKAIRYGVTDFILKNDLTERMPFAIGKARKQLEEKMAQDKQKETETTLMEKNRETIYENTMRNAVLGLPSPAMEDAIPSFHIVAICEVIPSQTNDIKLLLTLTFHAFRTVMAKISDGVFALLCFTDSQHKIVEGFAQIAQKLQETDHSIHLLSACSRTNRNLSALSQTTKEALENLHGLSLTGTGEASFPKDATLRVKILSGIQELDKGAFTSTLRRMSDSTMPFEELRLEYLRLFSTISGTFAPCAVDEDKGYLASLQKAQSRMNLHSLMEKYGMAAINSRIPFVQVSSPLIRSVNLYLQQHFREPINLQTVAYHFHVSDGYLSRLYRKETGVSILQTLTDIRLRAAKSMLSDPTVRISDIAESTGFSDSTYFSHLFQKETGYAPRDWRKKAGEVKF